MASHDGTSVTPNCQENSLDLILVASLGQHNPHTILFPYHYCVRYPLHHQTNLIPSLALLIGEIVYLCRLFILQLTSTASTIKSAVGQIALQNTMISVIMVLDRWNLIHLTGKRMMNTIVMVLWRYPEIFGLHKGFHNRTIPLNKI